MNQKNQKKTEKIFLFLLYSIFLITVIPTIYVYLEHASVEINAYENAKTETKKIKTLSEALLFLGIGLGYIIVTLLVFLIPESRIPYLVILVGTVIVVLIYWFRMYGLQIPFTNIFITDFSADHRDVITKICQNIMLIPISILFVLRALHKS